MNILITGASGLVGRHLVPVLRQQGHSVWKLSRSTQPLQGPYWNPTTGEIQLHAAGPLDAVVHLAGENIAQRWTRVVKRRIRESRVNATRLLSEALSRLEPLPRTLICASATGYYGNRGDEILDEQSMPGHGFLPEICKEWEAAAQPAEAAGIRVAQLRFGIILNAEGGALKRMLPPFKLGLGGKLGDGHAYWSWITLDDVLRIILRVLDEDSLRGAINAVSPSPVTNAEFTKTLGKVLGRPTLMPISPFILRVAFGEMAEEALLGSFRVIPARLLQHGYEFKFASLEGALRHLLHK